MDNNFLAENRLRQLSPELGKCYSECVARADKLLAGYTSNFPDYTDHSILHSVQVANNCNELIGRSIDELNASELYILLMSALLHDVGMGLDRREAAEFRRESGLEGGRKRKGDAEADFIRKHHHVLSAMFVNKHFEECRIPDRRLAFAIATVCEGHRKTDLWDRKKYPENYTAVKGEKANLAYLTAVLRLADEMDVSDSRNLMLQYAGFIPGNERGVMEFQKHRSVKTRIERGVLFLSAATDDEKEYGELEVLCRKLIDTYEDCAAVARKRAGREFAIRRVEKDIRFERKADLKIEIIHKGSIMTVRLSGILNSNSAPLLENRLAHRLHEGIRELHLDFGGLSYISSAGLRVVLSAQKKMNALGGIMTVANASPEVMEVFKMTGFHNILTFVREDGHGIRK